MIFDAIIVSLLPFEDYSGNQLLVLERTTVMWTEQCEPLTEWSYLKRYQSVWLDGYDGVFLSHAHMFLLDYVVKSWPAHTEGSTERQQLAEVLELWTCPDPCQGIPDKPQLCAGVTPIKMSLRIPCRWRGSLHKGMGHVMGCRGKSILWLQETYNGTFKEGKKTGKEMNLGDLRRSNHREIEG